MTITTTTTRPTETESPRPQHPISILLVEDEPTMQRILTKLIEGALAPRTIYLHAVTTASAAIRIAQAIEYDLIVSDYQLADGETGAELLRFLEREQPAMVPRFVFVTGSAEPRQIHDRVIDKGEPIESFAAAFRRLASAGLAAAEVA